MSRPKVTVSLDANRYTVHGNSILIKATVRFHQEDGTVAPQSVDVFNNFVKKWGQPQVNCVIEFKDATDAVNPIISEVPWTILFDSYSKVVDIKKSSYVNFSSFSNITLTIKRPADNSSPSVVFEKMIFDSNTNLTPDTIQMSEEVFSIGFGNDLLLNHSVPSTSMTNTDYSYNRDDGVSPLVDTYIDSGIAEMGQRNCTTPKASARVIEIIDKDTVTLPHLTHVTSKSGDEFTSYTLRYVNLSNKPVHLNTTSGKLIHTIPASSGNKITVTRVIVSEGHALCSNEKFVRVSLA